MSPFPGSPPISHGSTRRVRRGVLFPAFVPGFSASALSLNSCATTLLRSYCSHGSSVPTRPRHSQRFTISIAKG